MAVSAHVIHDDAAGAGSRSSRRGGGRGERARDIERHHATARASAEGEASAGHAQKQPVRTAPLVGIFDLGERRAFPGIG